MEVRTIPPTLEIKRPTHQHFGTGLLTPNPIRGALALEPVLPNDNPSVRPMLIYLSAVLFYLNLAPNIGQAHKPFSAGVSKRFFSSASC